MESSSKRRKGKIIHSEARKMASDVIKVCDEEALDKKLRLPVAKATERAALYTNLSKHPISYIRKERKNVDSTPGTSISTPGKKRKRENVMKKVVDSFDRRVIRDCISDSYINDKRAPSLRSLLPKIRAQIDFPWEKENLRRLLHEMNFKFKKCVNKRKISIERPDIVNSRNQIFADD